MSVNVTTTAGNSVSVSVNGGTSVSFTSTSTSVSVSEKDASQITVTNKGPKGDAGPTGPQGPQGPAGNDASSDIIDDTTPQLGGDLDVNGKKITSASNGDITIDPDGTGSIILKSDDIQFQTANVEVAGGDLRLYESNLLTPQNFIALQAPASVTADTTLILPDGAGSNGQVLSTNGSGALSWATTVQQNNPDLFGILELKTVGGSQGEFIIYDNDNSHYISIQAPTVVASNVDFILPAADGSANQVLKTDGSGNLSFVDQTTDTNTSLGDTDQTLSAERTVEMGTNHLVFKKSGTEVAKIFHQGYIQAKGRLIVNGNGTVGGLVKIGDADSSATVSLQAPTTLSSSLTFVLPTADGTNGQVLQTDGSGNLSFVTASGGGSSTLTQVFPMNFFDDLGTTRHYLPWKDINEQTTIYQEEAAMLMPYDGKIKSVSLKSSSLSADGDITLRVHTMPTGSNIFVGSSWTEEESETLSATSTDDHHTFHFVFDNAQHFEAGDSVTLSIQNSADITGNGYWYVTTIVEFDTSNGLGSSSTEHDTNP